MNVAARSGGLRVLHVLTLNGGNGEYGGPARVARETCGELDRQGWRTYIFSGSLVLPNFPFLGIENQGLVRVKPLSNKLPFSSLWSRKVPWTLWKQIRKSDIVHIHFARELIPIFAAYLCMILKKPYVTQTHGMVVFDSRRSIRFVDKLLTRRALNHSIINFVLTQRELNEMKPLGLDCDFKIVPNGIFVPTDLGSKNVQSNGKIVFCSRLQSRKRPDRFLELAKYMYGRNPTLLFEIYGPDGGELGYILERINQEKELSNVTYCGALQPQEVLKMLAGIDLMVLPSDDEPFGMITLEALSVGTSVLLMPSCGISQTVGNAFPRFISNSDDLLGIFESFELLEKHSFDVSLRESIQSFCRAHFSIENSVSKINLTYLSVLVHE